MPSGKVLVCQYDSERITVIEKLTLQNFKVLRDVEVGLRPLTVIVGPNASGKSSILQALFLITASFTKSESTLAQIFREESAIELFRSRSSKGPTALGFSARSDGREFSPEIVLDQDIPVATIPPIGDGRTRTGHVKAGAIELFARPAVVLKLDVVKLASPSYPKTTSLVLPKDGDGLSSVIAGLYLEDASRFRSLVERLRSVVAGVKDLHVRRAPAGGQIGYELVFDMQGAEGIPARAVSDGTLLTLGLLTVLAVPHPPQLLLIDDLERGLHPRALGDLVQQLRRVQEQNPELQIVATSHSPYLLDFVEAEEVLLTSLDEDGYAAVRPLTDHPEYERWKGLMAPGEFWSTVGESWITKKEPEPARAE